MQIKKGNRGFALGGEQSPLMTGRPFGMLDQRSPMRLNRDTGESGYGEMLYLDPNDVEYRRNQAMSPIPAGRQSQIGIRSPLNRGVISNVRNDLEYRTDTVRLMSREPIPTIKVTIDNSKHNRERSPKTINMGETEKDIEYNMRTLNIRKNTKESLQSINPVYQENSKENETNLSLDQPMQSGSFIQGQSEPMYQQGSPTTFLQNKNNNDYLNGSSNEIQYTMKPRDIREPLPSLMNKMSPNKNINDESNFDGKVNDSANQLKDLKTQLDRNSKFNRNEVDGMNQVSAAQIRGDMEKMEDYMKSKEMRETYTINSLRKIVRKMTKGYNPHDGGNGQLISMQQTIIPGETKEEFNERYKVLQKMNKLSTILLSKNRNESMTMTYNRNLEEKKKTFNRNTLNMTYTNKKGRQTLTRTPQNRFLYLSLAMISSRGPNCEDRIILRKMRFDKGGVVDLAQEAKKKQAKFQVKKFQRKMLAGTGKGKMNYNPKYRDKAARVVQGWWRDIKERYQKILNKIILIQSMWRGWWLRKYIYEIIYLSFIYQRFCEILQKTLVTKIRREVIDELFAGKKWGKDILYNFLTEKDDKLSLIRLKPYFSQWKDVSTFIQGRNLKSKNIVDKRELDKKNKKKLTKYLNRWGLKSNLEKYIELKKDSDKEKKKFFSAIDISHGINKLAMRSALNASKDYIAEYLAKKIQNNAVKKLILNTPKFEKLAQRRYFTNWGKQIERYQVKDFKDNIFGKILKILSRNINKKKIIECFNSWRSKIPKNTLIDYQKGAETLSRFCFRNTHIYPLKSIVSKSNYENELDGIMRMLGVKKRYINHHWREYLYKWRSQAQKSKDREVQNKLYATLLGTMLNKRRYRILSNRFSQWKKTPKLDLEELFDKYKAMNDMIRRTWNHVLKPLKEKFLNEIKTKVHPRSLKQAANRFMEKFIMKDRSLLRYYLYKWRDQCKNYEIYDIKLELLKYLGGMNNMKNRRNKMAKVMSKWKVLVNQVNAEAKAERTKNIMDGLERIRKMYMNREIEFMIRLFRLMNKDYRPKFIQNIVNKLFKPRGTVRDCLNKWRRVNDVESSNEKLKSLKGKVLRTNAKRYNERINRDNLSKAFFKWRAQSRNPEDYYPKIINGIKSLYRGMLNKYCKDNFNSIKKSKNYARRLIPVLKNNKHLMQRLTKDLIREKFDKWKNNSLKKNISSLRTNIIFRTKNNMNLKTKGQTLSKYFTKWKVYRPKKMDSNFYKGLMIVQNYCEKPYRKDVVESFKQKQQKILQNQGVEDLLMTSKTYRNRRVRNGLLKWWKKASKIDPKKYEKIKLKLKRMVNDIQMDPIDKYFHRWIRVLVKNPDYQNIIKGSDAIKKVFVKHNRDFLSKVNTTISKNFMSQRIFNKVLPNSKAAKNRSLRNYFSKWRNLKNKMNLKDLKANLLSKVYFNGKGAIRERFLRKYFKRWSYKEPERKPIDLFLLLQGWEKIHKVFSLKFMKGFYKNMDNYGRKKFLRSLLLGCSKYQIRAMKPYFDKWRRKTNKLALKSVAQDVSSKLMKKTKEYRTSYKIMNLMRSKWNQWKRSIKEINKVIAKQIPDGFWHLNKFCVHETSPYIIKSIGNKEHKALKNEATKRLPLKRRRYDMKNERKIFGRWRSQVTNMLIKDMKNRMKYNQLRLVFKIMEKGPLKYLLLWKFKAGIARKSSPIQMAIDRIRNHIIKDQFKKFVHRADMMNLKIPHGISIQSALIKKKRNLAKSIALRNISMRPYFEKWIKKTTALRNKAHRHHIFNTALAPILKSFDKLQMRRGLNTWRSKANQISKKDTLKQIRSKILYMLYGNGRNFELRRYFFQWMKNCDYFKKKLTTIQQGLEKLKVKAGRNVTDQLRKLLLRNNKFQKVKAILKYKLKVNDKNNIARAFSKWRILSNKRMEMLFKAKLLKNLGKKTDYKNKESVKNRMHQVFLHWRIRCAPRDYLDRMKRIRQGSKLLRMGIRNPRSKVIFEGIKNRANERFKRFLLNQFIKAVGPKSDMLNMRRAMNTWKAKLADTEILRNKMDKLLNDYLVSDPIHEKMIKEPEQIIINAMKAYNLMKQNKSKPIGSFCRAILNLKRNINRLKQSKYLFTTIVKLNKNIKDKAKLSLSKWLRNAKMTNTNEYASIIQKFLKSRLYNPSDKRKAVCRGGEVISKYLKRVIFSKLYQGGKEKQMNKVFSGHINNQNKNDNKTIRDKLTKWKNIVPVMRMHDAASKIQNNYRNLKSRKTHNGLKKRTELLTKNLNQKIDKDSQLLDSALKKWNRIMKNISCEDNAITIQRFIQKKLKELLKSKNQQKIKEMIKKNVILQLSQYMQKASRIIGDKGEVMFRTIEDIYIRRPFNKLRIGLKWLSHIKVLNKVVPKIKQSLRHYWVPYYVRKWKNKTWDDKIKKVIILQNWIKGRIAQLKHKKKLRKNQLIGKYMQKLLKDKEYLQHIPFTLWVKKVKYEKLRDATEGIQRIWKGGMSRKKANKLLNQSKLKNLFKKSFERKVIDILEEVTHYILPLKVNANRFNANFEKRYATNNLIDFANDALRNLYLLKLTGKKGYSDELSAKRRYFDRWRQYNSYMQMCATKIQCAYRLKQSKKKKFGLETLRKRLIDIHKIYEQDESEKRRVYLRKWMTISKYIKCNEMSSIIGKFIRPRLAKLLNQKFVDFFAKNVDNIAKKKINKAVKVNKLKNAIAKKQYKQFFNCLRNKTKFNKLKIIFVKSFNHLDTQLGNMLLDKYVQQWKDKKNMLTKKRNDSATKIQNAYLNYKSRMKVNLLRNRKQSLQRMMLKLINDNELKGQVAFNIWRTAANRLKINDYSNVLQDFMSDIKKKLQKTQNIRKRANIRKGLNKMNNVRIMLLRAPFEKIKMERNRRVFTKFNDLLMNKRKDLIKEVYDVIKKKEVKFLFDRVFKVPVCLKKKIYRKAFDKWSDNAKKISLNKSALKIQKNYRLFHSRNIKNRINEYIQNKLKQLAEKNSDIIQYFFNRWRKNVHKETIFRAGRKINKFIENKYKTMKAHQKWNKFSEKISLANGNWQSIKLLKRMQKFLSLSKFSTPIAKIVKRGVFDNLKKFDKEKRSKNFLSLLFKNYEKKNLILNQRKCLRNWKDILIKESKRQSALNAFLDAIDKRRKIIAVETINSVSLVKKLFKTIQKIRAKNFLSKLIKKSVMQKRLEAIGETLEKSKNELNNRLGETFAEKMYKILVYRKISKMFKCIENYMFKKVKIFEVDQFLSSLVNKRKENSYFNYKGEKSSAFIVPTTKLKFSRQICHPRNYVLDKEKDKSIPKLLPYFVRYLDTKFKERARFVMDKLIFNDRYGRFCHLFKRFSNHIKIEQKKELYNELVERTKYMDSQGGYLIRLFKFLRKYFVRHTTTTLVRGPHKIYMLLYLIKITYMHKRIARQRFMRELSRKWRFAAFVKKMSRKKLELMYKNLHVSYMQMANEVFGDEDDMNPSVMKEFERFGTNIGMFSREEPVMNDRKYVKKVEKKYVFNDKMLEDEVNIPKSKVIKEVDEEYSDFYIDTEMQETKGMYKKENDKKSKGTTQKKRK